MVGQDAEMPTAHRHAPAARDGALERVRRLTWWLVAGAAVGSAALVGLAAHEFPGHTGTAATTSTGGGATTTTAPPSGDDAGEGASGLPASSGGSATTPAPTPSTAPPSASTGAS